MKPHFIPTDVIVHKKVTHQEPIFASIKGLKSQTVKVEITLTSSGDTSKILEEKIGEFILKNLRIE